jgi:FAD/FMN-containing dehydrogenase
MLYNAFVLVRVFFCQLFEIMWFTKLNYPHQLKKTLHQFNKITGNTVYRTTKDMGTLFRANKKKAGFSLDNLSGIIKLDSVNKTIDVGGKTRFYDVLKFTLKHNLMPKIVPELSSITVGGAICGVAIESSSFKYGWVHDTIIDMDILTASGDVLNCTQTNEHKDLFNSMPNSYGTFGYITRVKLQLVDAKKYVKLINHKFDSSDLAFSFMKKCVTEPIDFIDAVAYSKNEIYVVVGKLSNDNTDLSSYPRDGMYYKTIKKLRHDTLSIYDYFWRWDADMFWGAPSSILNNKIFRKIFGRSFLNTRVLMAAEKVFLNKPSGREKIVQDLGVPGENVGKFYDWVCETISKYPIWICPVIPKKMDSHFWTFNENKLYFDVGVFTSKKSTKPHGHYNKLIEKKLLEMDGNKCFYSDTFLNKKDFDGLIDPDKYLEMKLKYDENYRFGNLYDKIIDKS